MRYWKYLVREAAHYFATITIDRGGCYLDKQAKQKCQEWSQLRLPPIPYRT